MPAKSKAQYRFMQAVAHGNIKKEGLSKEKAKEYIDKTRNLRKLKERVNKK